MKHATPTRHITAKTVLLAFFVSFSVFGSVLLMAAVSHDHTEHEPSEAGASLGRVHTVALFFRKTVDELTGAVLLTVDTRRMEMTATGVAPDEEIAGRSLQDLYKIGSLYAATQLAAEHGTSADGVLSFSVSNVAALLVYLKDRLPLELSEQVDILPQGESTLTPIQVADVLRYDEWTDGSAGCARIHADVITAILNRYLTAERDLEADFKMLTSLCDDRLSISQFEAVRDELAVLAKVNEGAVCTAQIS